MAFQSTLAVVFWKL